MPNKGIVRKLRLTRLPLVRESELLKLYKKAFNHMVEFYILDLFMNLLLISLWTLAMLSWIVNQL